MCRYLKGDLDMLAPSSSPGKIIVFKELPYRPCCRDCRWFEYIGRLSNGSCSRHQISQQSASYFTAFLSAKSDQRVCNDFISWRDYEKQVNISVK